MVTLEINGKNVTVPEGTTILKAAESAGIHIHTLCYLKEINEIGACRVCMVEVKGMNKLAAACNTVVEDGMVVDTDSLRARTARKVNVQLILSEHDCHCPTCYRSGNCSLQEMANDMNILDVPFKSTIRENVDDTAPILRKESKCIKCMRCVQICEKIQGMNIWDILGTGGRTNVGIGRYPALSQSPCTFCGQCVTHCPTGALTVRDDTEDVFRAIDDPRITTVVQVAPAVRAAWAEDFGLTDDVAVPGRMVSALKALGFDYVFDTDFAADLTIMEEGSELLERLKTKSDTMPMFTSCCPGWMRFLKSQYPKLVPCASTAKSPQQMFGSIVKSYFAKKIGKNPRNIYCVSVMPCSAKKYESSLPEMTDEYGDPDVNTVLTTREFARMLRVRAIKPADLPETPFDSPLGLGTGAAVIFGASGGVMTAALRSAYYLVTGTNPDPDAFSAVRTESGCKTAQFEIPGFGILKTAVVSGLGNARALIDRILAGKEQYDFVEVMACPGGCAGGGGQPISDGQEKTDKRSEKLWELDKKEYIRFSHENPEIKALYDNFLGAPLSERSHALLHVKK